MKGSYELSPVLSVVLQSKEAVENPAMAVAISYMLEKFTFPEGIEEDDSLLKYFIKTNCAIIFFEKFSSPRK